MYKSWVKPPLWNLAGLVFKWGGIFFHLTLAIAWAMPTSNEREMLSSNEALKELKPTYLIFATDVHWYIYLKLNLKIYT